MHITAPRLFKLVLAAALTAIVTGCGSEGGSVSARNAATTLKAIEVSSDNAQAAVGTSAQLTATAVYSDGTHQDITSQASWSSSMELAVQVRLDPALADRQLDHLVKVERLVPPLGSSVAFHRCQTCEYPHRRR